MHGGRRKNLKKILAIMYLKDSLNMIWNENKSGRNICRKEKSKKLHLPQE